MPLCFQTLLLISPATLSHLPNFYLFIYFFLYTYRVTLSAHVLLLEPRGVGSEFLCYINSALVWMRSPSVREVEGSPRSLVPHSSAGRSVFVHLSCVVGFFFLIDFLWRVPYSYFRKPAFHKCNHACNQLTRIALAGDAVGQVNLAGWINTSPKFWTARYVGVYRIILIFFRAVLVVRFV